jgi:hypothetical protein
MNPESRGDTQRICRVSGFRPIGSRPEMTKEQKIRRGIGFRAAVFIERDGSVDYFAFS